MPNSIVSGIISLHTIRIKAKKGKVSILVYYDSMTALSLNRHMI